MKPKTVYSMNLMDIVMAHVTAYLAEGNAPPFVAPHDTAFHVALSMKAAGMKITSQDDLGDLLARAEMIAWGWLAAMDHCAKSKKEPS